MLEEKISLKSEPREERLAVPENAIELEERPVAEKPVKLATEEPISVQFEDLPPRDDCWQRLCYHLLCSEAARRQRCLSIAKKAAIALTLLAFLAYLAFCSFLLATRFRGTPEAEQSVRLLWVSALAAAIAASHWLPRWFPSFAVSLAEHWRWLRGSCARRLRPVAAYWWVPQAVIALAFIVWMVVLNPANLASVGGLVLLLLVALLFSAYPDRVAWRPILNGMTLQLIFAALILRTSWGFQLFGFLGDRAAEFVAHCQAGSRFVFGDSYQEHFLAFAVLPIEMYFSAVITVLFHLGALQAVICRLGAVMQVAMGTTAAESMVAAANIFVGLAEAPMMVRPFLPLMTKSEIHSVMTSGLATIAGGVMAAYIAMGIPARHLLSASVMSAPAALAVSKLVFPETQRSRTRAADLRKLRLAKYGGVVEAAGTGAIASLAVVGAIVANLVAFVSILEFVNATVTWLGYRAGLEFPLTFEFIVSYVLWPLPLVMGVTPRDCRQVAELIGIKTFLNEFVAYGRLVTIKNNYRAFKAAAGNSTVTDVYWTGQAVVSPSLNLSFTGGFLFEGRSMVVATYSLCGFSNLGSIGVLMGALIAMAPGRRSDIGACALRALLAGSIACFITACIAGLFAADSDLVLDF